MIDYDPDIHKPFAVIGAPEIKYEVNGLVYIVVTIRVGGCQENVGVYVDPKRMHYKEKFKKDKDIMGSLNLLAHHAACRYLDKGY
jgi:hypothetical protein